MGGSRTEQYRKDIEMLGKSRCDYLETAGKFIDAALLLLLVAIGRLIH